MRFFDWIFRTTRLPCFGEHLDFVVGFYQCSHIRDLEKNNLPIKEYYKKAIDNQSVTCLIITDLGEAIFFETFSRLACNVKFSEFYVLCEVTWTKQLQIQPVDIAE